MKISVFYDHVVEASEQTKLTLSQVLKKVNQFSIAAVDIDWQRIIGCREEVKTKLDDAKLTTAAVYGFFDFGNTFDYEKACSFIDDAAYMEAEKVLVVAGFVEEKESEKYHKALDNMAKALNTLCDYAETKGITVTLEDFDDKHAPFSTDEELLWFMQHVPKLRCTFDTGNFKYQEIDELKAFELLKDKIVHVHCKDRSLVNVEGEAPGHTITGTEMYSSPVGYGCIHMKEIIYRLQKLGYDDYLSIEHFGSLNQLSYIEKSAKWILEQL